MRASLNSGAGFGDGAEEQKRHGDLKDEFAERFADIRRHQSAADDHPADENQDEDGKDVENDG